MTHPGHDVLDVLAANLAMLKARAGWSNAEIVRRARGAVTAGTVGGILRRTHVPGIDKVDRIAAVFGLRCHHLLMPGLRAELIEDGTFDALLRAYVGGGDDGRRVLEALARYMTRRAEGG